ncbi:hypothetical protein C8Q76DRAFT_159467 [Earliella scabrosa]|nr:hypothetical protein C8Q76DRAFT_159467 [Earliella scabrosa]
MVSLDTFSVGRKVRFERHVVSASDEVSVFRTPEACRPARHPLSVRETSGGRPTSFRCVVRPEEIVSLDMFSLSDKTSVFRTRVGMSSPRHPLGTSETSGGRPTTFRGVVRPEEIVSLDTFSVARTARCERDVVSASDKVSVFPTRCPCFGHRKHVVPPETLSVFAERRVGVRQGVGVSGVLRMTLSVPDSSSCRPTPSRFERNVDKVSVFRISTSKHVVSPDTISVRAKRQVSAKHPLGGRQAVGLPDIITVSSRPTRSRSDETSGGRPTRCRCVGRVVSPDTAPVRPKPRV